jgi:hypothetical protein
MATKKKIEKTNLIVSNDGLGNFEGIVIQKNGVLRIRRIFPKRKRNMVIFLAKMLAFF